MDAIVSRKAIMDSLTEEYNRRWEDGGLKLAWIELAVNRVPEVTDMQRLRDKIAAVIADAEKSAELYDARAKQLYGESAEVSQYTWAVNLRETHRRFVMELEDVLQETEAEA